MHAYPHVYRVAAQGGASGPVSLQATGLPTLDTAPPPEFDGPGGTWSPETLLTGALADCFIFTFRAVARASSLDWLALECDVEATLEKVEGITRFTGYRTRARLTVPAATDEAKARRALERAEHACLIANSLNGTRSLDAVIIHQPS